MFVEYKINAHAHGYYPGLFNRDKNSPLFLGLGLRVYFARCLLMFVLNSVDFTTIFHYSLNNMLLR